MKQIYNFPILGNITINIDNISLGRFTKRQLKNYFVNEKSSPSDSTYIEYTNRDVSERLKKFADKYYQLGRKISVTYSSLEINEYSYTVKDNTISVKRNYKKPIWYKSLKKLYYISFGNTENKKYASLHSRYYEDILFPLLSLFALSGGYYCLHGSLLEINHKYIIISGLDGVGKSSVSNYIELNGKGRLLSDNIVLFNGQYAVPLNCAMRLPAGTNTSCEVLYTSKEFVEVFPPCVIFDKCIIDRVFNLSVSKDNFHIHPIDNSLSQLVLFLNNAPEINKANEIVSVLAYIHSLADSSGVDNNINKFYDWSIPLGKIEEAVEVLLNEC